MTTMLPEGKGVRKFGGLKSMENEVAKQNFDYVAASQKNQSSSADTSTPNRGKTVTKTSGMAQLLSPADNSLKTTLG